MLKGKFGFKVEDKDGRLPKFCVFITFFKPHGTLLDNHIVYT